jgi:hypothetical protein
MSNVGAFDRAVRAIAGLALVLLPFFSGWAIWSETVWSVVSVVVGLVLIGTAAFSFCPIYAALGLSSKRKP